MSTWEPSQTREALHDLRWRLSPALAGLADDDIDLLADALDAVLRRADDDADAMCEEYEAQIKDRDAEIVSLSEDNAAQDDEITDLRWRISELEKELEKVNVT